MSTRVGSQAVSVWCIPSEGMTPLMEIMERAGIPYADGTVTLRLSSNTKGKAEDTNFLPTSNEDFYLVLRMYGGDEEIQAGKFPVPVVQKVGK